MERCIHIFPKFENYKWIDDTRKKYDYLHELVAPHITLVFPFEIDMTTEEVAEHIQTYCSSGPFELMLNRAVAVESYLFLVLGEGEAAVKALNTSLYKGKLSPYKADRVFLPHMTIGRFESEAAASQACQELELKEVFTCTVDTIEVEIIGADESSTIEYTHKLLEV